jgi:hypothetical protein
VPPVPAAGGVVAGGVGVTAPELPPVAAGDPPVPGAPPADEDVPEPETCSVDEVGAVEPPVPALSGVLEPPVEPPVPRGSSVMAEPPSGCDPPEPAPAAQPIVRDAASGSSVARKEEMTLLCFKFERGISSGTGHDRTSDVYSERPPQAASRLSRVARARRPRDRSGRSAWHNRHESASAPRANRRRRPPRMAAHDRPAS